MTATIWNRAISLSPSLQNKSSKRSHREAAYSDSDELLVEDDPGEQVDAGHVGGKQGHHVCRQEDSQRVDVHVVGSNPKKREQAASR